MVTIDSLREWGADVDKGLARCMGNEGLYLRLVGMTADNHSMDECRKALADGDLKGAFEAAHALKGVLGNLDLTPIYSPISTLTEALRGQTGDDYQALCEEAGREWDKLIAMIKG